MKLVIVIGTRPEIIRLSATINLARELFETTLVHTGQNYDPQLNDVFFDELGIAPPDHYLDCSRDNLGRTVGDIIQKSYEFFSELKPDALLVLGDTNSCLCAYSAKRLKIPIFHVEAGNRCFDPNVPEEINRKIIDHLSDVNMCYMEHARRNLLSEGLKSQYTFVVGSPMPEIIKNISNKIERSDVLKNLNIKSKEYILISLHREENVNIEKNFDNIVECINKIDSTFKKKIVISVHPRTRKILSDKNITFSDNVIMSIPFGIVDYCYLQTNAICVISDSGTLTEESTILNFPAILLRNSTEHPEGIDSGNIILGDNMWTNLERNINLAIRIGQWNNIESYNDMNVSNKICKIISGYVGIVDKFVWMK